MLIIVLADALDENMYFAVAEKSREKIRIFSEKRGVQIQSYFILFEFYI